MPTVVWRTESRHARLKKALLYLTGKGGKSLKPRRDHDGLGCFTKTESRASIEIRCEHDLLRYGLKKPEKGKQLDSCSGI